MNFLMVGCKTDTYATAQEMEMNTTSQTNSSYYGSLQRLMFDSPEAHKSICAGDVLVLLEKFSAKDLAEHFMDQTAVGLM